MVRSTDATAKAFGGIRRIPTLYVFARAGRLAFDVVGRTGAAKTNADERAAVIEVPR